MKREAWNFVTSTTDRYNEPGRFTTFIGFEWTSMPGGNNIHRVLAIPHNSNLSNGILFAPKRQSDGSPIDAAYARRHLRFEPLVEVTQAKGTSEAHLLLSSEDEFAGFEIYDKVNISGSEAKTPDMLPFEYARPALKLGMQLETRLGVNPFKFGMVGSTDSHTALATTAEDNWFGKASIVEPSADLWKDVLIKSQVDPALSMTPMDLAASGLAAVWARENIREAIWDAMAREEVYVTTGTRLRVRVFAAQGYAKGVPMWGPATRPIRQDPLAS
jgi:hypothetical protein